ncbi:MAG: hypothetical protein JSU01_24035, partial [Bacteroidetes bacterium]|nr:hypothetical protein [Bacteroidota bacterium]
MFPEDEFIDIPGNNAPINEHRQFVMCRSGNASVWRKMKYLSDFEANLVLNHLKGQQTRQGKPTNFAVISNPLLLESIAEELANVKQADDDYFKAMKDFRLNDLQKSRADLNIGKIKNELANNTNSPTPKKEKLMLIANKLNLYGDTFLLEGDYDDALAAYRLSLDAVTDLNVYFKMTKIEAEVGYFSRSLADLKKIDTLAVSDSHERAKVQGLHLMLDLAGQKADTTEIKNYEQLFQSLKFSDGAAFVESHFNIGFAYVAIGKVDKGMQIINDILPKVQPELKFAMLLNLIYCEQLRDEQEIKGEIYVQLDNVLSKITKSHPEQEFWKALYFNAAFEKAMITFQENSPNAVNKAFDQMLAFTQKSRTLLSAVLFTTAFADFDDKVLTSRETSDNIRFLQGVIAKLEVRTANPNLDFPFFALYNILASYYVNSDDKHSANLATEAYIKTLRHLYQFAKHNNWATGLLLTVDILIDNNDVTNKARLDSAFKRIVDDAVHLPESDDKLVLLTGVIAAYLREELTDHETQNVRTANALPILLRYSNYANERAILLQPMTDYVNTLIFNYYFRNHLEKQALTFAEDKFAAYEKQVTMFPSGRQDIFVDWATACLLKTKLSQEPLKRSLDFADSVVNQNLTTGKSNIAYKQIACKFAVKAYPILLNAMLPVDSAYDEKLMDKLSDMQKRGLDSLSLKFIYFKVVEAKCKYYDDALKKAGHNDAKKAIFKAYIHFVANPRMTWVTEYSDMDVPNFLPDPRKLSRLYSRFGEFC